MNAEIIKAEPNPTFPGAVLVTIRCPLCGKKHVHGVPKQDVGTQVYGHRISHCTGTDHLLEGYFLTDPGGLVHRALDAPGSGGVQAGAGFDTRSHTRAHRDFVQTLHLPAPKINKEGGAGR